MALRFERAASALWNVDGRARAKAGDRAERKVGFQAKAGTSVVVRPGFGHDLP